MSYLAIIDVSSTGRGRCHASLRRQYPSRLHPSPNGAPSWCISREGRLPRLPQSGRLGRFRPSATDAPSWCISRKGPLPYLHRSRGLRRHRQCPRHLQPSPTGAPILFFSREGPLPCLHRQCPRRLRPSPNGEPTWCISQKGLLQRLLPWARPRRVHRSSTGARRCTSPRNGPYHTSLRRQRPCRLLPSPNSASRW